MATATITVTCRRCGKRHDYEAEFMDDHVPEEYIISLKQEKPLCRACKRKLGLADEDL
jgi:hypothetical protein